MDSDYDSGNVDEAVAWFHEHPHPDLIFLDIHLADGNAFDFLSAVHPSSVIIFTTAYDQYAIRAFTVNSIDYILKPIDEKRLSEAIVKYESLLNNAVPGRKIIWVSCLKHFNTKRNVTVPVSLFPG